MRAMVVRPGFGFSVQDVAQGWVDGLASVGCQVVDYNLEDRLTFYSNATIEGRPAFNQEDAIRLAVKGIEAALYETFPDLVVVISGFFLEPRLYQLMKARGQRVVLIHTESPYENDRQVALAGFADLNLINDPTDIERFRAVNPNTHYMPHAYDPARHHPRQGRPEHVSDFCFVGTGYAERIEFLEQVDWHGIDVALAGNWQALSESSPLRKHLAHDIEVCCDNSETVDLYAGTKASVNLYRRQAQRPELEAGWSCGPREIELAACGKFFLREPRGEGDALFPMLPTFTSPGEFEDKLRWWLGHPEERAAAAEAARAAVAPLTFKRNAQRLLELLDA